MSKAKRRSTSRSAFVDSAARREDARRDIDEVEAAVKRSERRFAVASSVEAADLVRADRDGRR